MLQIKHQKLLEVILNYVFIFLNYSPQVYEKSMFLFRPRPSLT